MSGSVRGAATVRRGDDNGAAARTVERLLNVATGEPPVDQDLDIPAATVRGSGQRLRRVRAAGRRRGGHTGTANAQHAGPDQPADRWAGARSVLERRAGPGPGGAAAGAGRSRTASRAAHRWLSSVRPRSAPRLRRFSARQHSAAASTPPVRDAGAARHPHGVAVLNSISGRPSRLLPRALPAQARSHRRR